MPRTTAPKKPARKLVTIPSGFPTEVVALAKKLSLIRLKRTECGWTGEVSVGERRCKEQASMKRGFNAALKALSKKPWKRTSVKREGWDGQTDTGGNSTSHATLYVHGSGVHVRLYEGTSFRTGTYTWALAVYVPTTK